MSKTFNCADVAELANAQDRESCGSSPYGFESRRPQSSYLQSPIRAIVSPPYAYTFPKMLPSKTIHSRADMIEPLAAKHSDREIVVVSRTDGDSLPKTIVLYRFRVRSRECQKIKSAFRVWYAPVTVMFEKIVPL